MNFWQRNAKGLNNARAHLYYRDIQCSGYPSVELADQGLGPWSTIQNEWLSWAMYQYYTALILICGLPVRMYPCIL
jgi:hypothetical protein